MALTPGRRLGAPRPPLNNYPSTPNLNLAASTSAIAHRKASLQALTGGPTTPTNTMGADGREIGVGDLVDVPGGMSGTVKFVGSVQGKKGVFAGVELDTEYLARGKNDGDVDGIRYFTTSVPGAGIFLPIHRATKRTSVDSDLFPPTPTTPSYAKFSLSTTSKPNFSPDPPSLPKFSQSLGPGGRSASPVSKSLKGRSPSLPRSESPFRKQPSLAPTPGRNTPVTPGSGFSKSAIGPPRFNSPAPRGPVFQKSRTPGPPRSFSRNSSRLGHHDTIDEDAETTPVARMNNGSAAGFPARGPGSDQAEKEVQRLKALLDERDKQLSAQAASLAEMESSLAEIQDLIPDDGMDLGRTRNGFEPNDIAQLRALLREKNDRIAMLTAEFDNHRADFRSTIDTLELASTETERVYERKVEELQNEIREWHERGEDVESVANQLKQLEELVQELEEGLEDARRGEAEARGEVEFLRGEVERGRSELRREREKAAAALKGAGAMMEHPLSPGSKEVEQRDDEIRGLKAIIHSLSSGPDEHSRSPVPRQGSFPSPEELKAAQANAERLEREKEELQGLVERKTFREEELEREVARLRTQLGAAEQRASVSSSNTEQTAIQTPRSPDRDSKGTVVSWRGSPQAKRKDAPLPMEPMLESDTHSSVSSVLWCEICETGGHDILNCSAMSGDGAVKLHGGPIRNGSDMVIEGLRNLSVSSDRPTAISPTKYPGSAPTAPLPIPLHASSHLVPPKGSSVADPDKWCALCESEGHDVTACPNEDAF